jgi:hypothetical protein
MAYIDNLRHHRTIMHAREYDRIADMLMQIKLKIRNNLTWTNITGKWTIEHYTNMVNNLLHATDDLAEADQKGLI